MAKLANQNKKESENMTDDEQKTVDFLDKQLAEQGFSDQTLRRKVAMGLA